MEARGRFPFPYSAQGPRGKLSKFFFLIFGYSDPVVRNVISAAPGVLQCEIDIDFPVRPPVFAAVIHQIGNDAFKLETVDLH